jgi:hypothetical protein
MKLELLTNATVVDDAIRLEKNSRDEEMMMKLLKKVKMIQN